MTKLLRLQAQGRITLAREGYLSTPHLDRAVTMSGWLDLPGVPGGVLGMKWVTSRPKNILRGLPRGRSITVLNDGLTGLPVLVYDGTAISNARTALFALVAVDYVLQAEPTSVALLGAGRVHAWQAHYMQTVWPSSALLVYDPDRKRALGFVETFGGRVLDSWEEAVRAEVLSIATAGAPNAWLGEYGPAIQSRVILNTSLRDVTPSWFTGTATTLIDDYDLVREGDTPFVRAQLQRIDPTVAFQVRRVCDLPILAGDEVDFPVMVNAMGSVAWDVGLGYYIWEEQFNHALQGVR